MIYITVSEDYYGGLHDINVYRNLNSAKKYIQCRNDHKDWKIVSIDNVVNDTILLLLCEDYYGGDNIKAFTSSIEADEYRKTLDDDKDYIILSRSILI